MSAASAEGTVRGQGPEDKKACPESIVRGRRDPLLYLEHLRLEQSS